MSLALLSFKIGTKASRGAGRRRSGTESGVPGRGKLQSSSSLADVRCRNIAAKGYHENMNGGRGVLWYTTLRGRTVPLDQCSCCATDLSVYFKGNIPIVECLNLYDSF